MCQALARIFSLSVFFPLCQGPPSLAKSPYLLRLERTVLVAPSVESLLYDRKGGLSGLPLLVL